MTLPNQFKFSQSSLHDFSECRRRFYYRYLRKLAWPAAESEPVMDNESHVQQGILFHRLIHQHLLGIPEANLSLLLSRGEPQENQDLMRWWQNYLSHPPLPETEGLSLFPEASLSVPLARHRLVAKFDLIAALPDGSLMIYDWKTARRHPKRAWLKNHLQTRVYQYLLARSGSHFTPGQTVQPEQVQMTYWFTEFPDEPEHFTYNQRQFSLDGPELEETIETIERLASSDDEALFPLTSNEDRCRFCVYRSLCDRGQHAGNTNLLAGMEDVGLDQDQDFDLDFEQIGEIEF